MDFKINYPLNNSPISLGCDFSAGGYVGDMDYFLLFQDFPVGLIMQAVPTIRVPLGGRVDAVCGVGYTYLMDPEWASSDGFLSIKFGLKFHSAQKRGEVQKVKALRHNRDRERNFRFGKWNFNMSKDEQK